MLGGIVGNETDKKSFVVDKIDEWISQVECLTEIAATQPQAAFAAFTKSLQFQWGYMQRVTSGSQSWFCGLEDVIWKKFLPGLMMSDVSRAERVLYSLPARCGGLGVLIPTESGDLLFSTSRSASKVIVECIKSGDEFVNDLHNECLLEVKAD